MSLPVWARDAPNRCLLRMVANVVYADRLEALEACRRCRDALRVAGRCPKPKLRDLEQPNAALTSRFAGSRVGGTGYFRAAHPGYFTREQRQARERIAWDRWLKEHPDSRYNHVS